MAPKPRTGILRQDYGTVIGAVVLLLFSLLSAMRLTSSTHAWTVCDPETAVQKFWLFVPLLAVSVTDAPGARDVVFVSLQVIGVVTPSTAN